MERSIRLLPILILVLFGLRGHHSAIWQQASTPPMIHAPLPDQVLQGSVAIIATTAISGFQSAELSFAYANNPTDTWFLIQQSDQPVANGFLAQWDTSTISDGIYTLRLVVNQQDGGSERTTVSGLRVRNYTPIETDTPAPVLPTATLLAGNLATATALPSPTITAPPPMTATPPPNPAQLSRQSVLGSVGLGALAALGLFVILETYQALRVALKRK